MDLLLVLLRGGRPAAPEAEWQAALALADREQVAPFLLHRLHTLRVDLPPGASGRALQMEREAATSAFWWSSELRGILRAFAAPPIPVIPLKGPVLAERLFGNPALRPARDLDLLVRRGDRSAAAQLLQHLGFTADPFPDLFQHSFRRGTTLVELHTDVEDPLAFPFGVGGAWARSLPSSFAGAPIRQFTPADELLFLCLHGVRHRFGRLGYALDVAGAIGCFGPPPPPGAGQPLAPVLQLGCAMARRLDPAIAASLPPIPPAIELLADRLWFSLVHQEPGLPLTWQAQHCFFLELEPTPWRRFRARLRHLTILGTRLIPADFHFAARAGVRSRLLVRMLRPLRLLRRVLRLR